MRISDWSSDVCSSDLIFVFAEAITQFISAWLSGEWAGWGWLWSSLFTVALWPLADIVLHLPQRPLDEPDAGAGSDVRVQENNPSSKDTPARAGGGGRWGGHAGFRGTGRHAWVLAGDTCGRPCRPRVQAQ